MAPDIFITAAHVWHGAATDGEPCLAGGSPGTPLGAAFVEDHEIHDDIDIAIIKTTTKPDITPLRSWCRMPLAVLTEVFTFGFPHAVTKDQNNEARWNAHFRAFRGHLIIKREWDRRPEQPIVYECSVPFPLGLSGGPLMFESPEGMLVVGVVLGVDEVEYGGILNRAGVALVSDQLLDRHSKLLGGPFAKQLDLELFPRGPDSTHPVPGTMLRTD